MTGLACLRAIRLTAVPLAVVGMLVSNLTGLVRGRPSASGCPSCCGCCRATAALPVRQRRAWLAASAVLVVSIEVTVRTEW